MGSSFIGPSQSGKAVQARRIVDQNLLQQIPIVVDITIEQLDRFGIVHHSFLAPIHVRPIAAPDHPIGRRRDESLAWNA